MQPVREAAFLSCEFCIPEMQMSSEQLFIYTSYSIIDFQLQDTYPFLTGDGDDEKRLSKQGGVRGQGLGRGKARMQGLLPGVLFGEEVGVGRDFE